MNKDSILVKTSEKVLRIKNISKRFGGTLAVNNISFDLYPGEILALLGENGAGKSTLIKILAGVYPADSGQINLLGQEEHIWRKLPKNQQGIAFIHQDLGLVEWMTIAENIAIGMGYSKNKGLINWKNTENQAKRVLSHVGLNINPNKRVFSLSRTEKSLLVIGRALDSKAQILVLDEPTASLPANDVSHLFEVLNKLKNKNVAMIYVSHRLDEIMQISNRCVAMRDGKLVGVRETNKVNTAELVELIVGKDLTNSKNINKNKIKNRTEIVLKIENLVSNNLKNISFEAKRGEILGLVGLRGAGHETVGRTIFGLSNIITGKIFLNYKEIKPKKPIEAIRAGISLVASDRLEENLSSLLTVQENLFLNPKILENSSFSLNPKLEKSLANKLIKDFDINPSESLAEIQNLSGGNQQKVILARWFNLKKPLLILEEPTSGIDVGAKYQIYSLLKKQAENGICILVISTDFEEIEKVCSRVLVFRSGQIVNEIKNEDINMNQLLSSCLDDKVA